MSVTVAAGARSLLSFGVALGDIAIAIEQGRRFGNWLRTKSLDEELFTTIGDVEGNVIKRTGIIHSTVMASKWPLQKFIYEGNVLDIPEEATVQDTAQDFSPFSWAMIAIISALDVCMSPIHIPDLLVNVLVKILVGGDDQQLRNSLKVQLPTNIESWRSAGLVRQMAKQRAAIMRRCRQSLVGAEAIPQLNSAEQKEMEGFLIWLLAENTNATRVVSATVFSTAEWLRKAGLHIKTEGERLYETEPIVFFEKKLQSLGGFLEISGICDRTSPSRGFQSRAQQISFRRGQAKTMVDTIPVERPVSNMMKVFWDLGEEAAVDMKLVAGAVWPFSPTSEIYYTLESYDHGTNIFSTQISMLAGHGFPNESSSILSALEKLVEGLESRDPGRIVWLNQHTSLEFLSKAPLLQGERPENMDLFAQYQALVFGFYYKLLDQLIVLDQVEETAYFRWIWGHGSTLFLSMCSELAKAFRRGKVSRTHLLFLLSAMYDGRQIPYMDQSSKRGLIGILGTISVLTLPLLRVTDQRSDVAKFAFVDLPVIDLVPEANGELYSGEVQYIDFFSSDLPPKMITPRNPDTRWPWSVHAKMGMLVDGQTRGVMMAVRCGGSLVGYFGPLAADVAFLSEAYVAKRHEADPDYIDEIIVKGFEITEDDWKKGCVQKPIMQEHWEQIVVVHSRGNALLRYAASGIFASSYEELAIVTDDIDAAVGRVQGQGCGVIIT